jgi:uncharacterized protein (DUF1684 family)
MDCIFGGMMKPYKIACLSLLILSLIAACGPVGLNEKDCRSAHIRFLEEQMRSFADAEHSPLTDKDRERFQFINYYPYNESYCVQARWIRTPDEQPFEMPTTTDRLPMYVKYGEVHFELNGDSLVLAAYQDIEYSQDPEHANYLFIPFNDLTNGVSSYGGGRYMDFEIPEGETAVLNFNNSYHPYCAYDHRYSCPIPPEENLLDVTIAAGVRSGINGEEGEPH